MWCCRKRSTPPPAGLLATAGVDCNGPAFLVLSGSQASKCQGFNFFRRDGKILYPVRAPVLLTRHAGNVSAEAACSGGVTSCCAEAGGAQRVCAAAATLEWDDEEGRENEDEEYDEDEVDEEDDRVVEDEESSDDEVDEGSGGDVEKEDRDEEIDEDSEKTDLGEDSDTDGEGGNGANEEGASGEGGDHGAVPCEPEDATACDASRTSECFYSAFAGTDFDLGEDHLAVRLLNKGVRLSLVCNSR